MFIFHEPKLAMSNLMFTGMDKFFLQQDFLSSKKHIHTVSNVRKIAAGLKIT